MTGFSNESLLLTIFAALNQSQPVVELNAQTQ
jgi:hypothetical protein